MTKQRWSSSSCPPLTITDCRFPIVDCRFFEVTVCFTRQSEIANWQLSRSCAGEIERAHRAHHNSASYGIAFDCSGDYRVNALAAHIDVGGQPYLVSVN